MTNQNNTILIIDDEDDIRLLIQGLLEDEGYKTLSASNSTEAYECIDQHNPALVIQDIWLQGSDDDGLKILEQIKTVKPDLPFIMISGHGTIETAVSAIKLGAYDFIEKPFKSDRLLFMIERALENAFLKKQNADLKTRSSKNIKEQASILPKAILETLDKVSATNSRIFITGEAGSGKKIAAQYIHNKSDRADYPFMTLNCAGTAPEQVEEELFGTARKSGMLALANGGTLVLDEIVNLPLNIQGKVLNVLQESAYCAIGDNTKNPIDIRILATNSTAVESYIEQGTFREDLFYRLNVVPLHIPALRERKIDIPALIHKQSNLDFSKASVALLQSYRWPGNIKQLNNVLEWVSIIHANTRSIEVEHLPPEFSNPQASNQHSSDDERFPFIERMMHMGLREARECFEKHYLLEQISKFDGNISKTAEFIGMERSALHRKLKSLDVFSDDKQNVA
ncbi:MAG: sigma-54-dependent transcriptional regulator [Alphaproteobacteria bacterium]